MTFVNSSFRGICAFALALGTASTLGAQGAPASTARSLAPGFEIHATGVAASIAPFPPVESDEVIWLLVDEGAQGGADLNGDGDTDDEVIHWYSVVDQALTNVGISARNSSLTSIPPQATEDRIAFTVFEDDEGRTDLNGDGDADDFVCHLYDRRTGELTNLELAASCARMQGNLLVLVAYEHSEQTDFNGDGGLNDAVVQLHAIEQGVTFNVGVSTDSIVDLAGTLLAFQTREGAEGNTDLNGDGDTGDTVLSIHDLSTQQSSYLGAVEFHLAQQDWILTEDYIFYFLSESHEGTDLNGDGDLIDEVAHVHYPSTGITTNLGFGTSPFVPHAAVAGGYVLVNVEEHGLADLNGDGDVIDDILHIFDPSDGSMTSLQVALAGNTWLSLPPPNEVGGIVGFAVGESNNTVNLNGDPDLEDSVAHSVRLERPFVVTNHGLAGFVAGVGDDLVGVTVVEQDHFNMSLNGDTDTEDFVPHVVDTATGTISSFGIAGAMSGISDRWFVRYVSEEGESEDRNGDGDLGDRVALVQQFGRPPIHTGLAMVGSANRTGPNTAVFWVSESGQGDTDLNGDGDADDFVLFVVRRVTPSVPD